MGQYVAGMRTAQGATQGFARNVNTQMVNAGRTMTNVGRRMTRSVTVPLLAVGAGAAKMATDFDTSMTRITALVGVGSDEVDGMRDSVMDLSGETARAPGELAEALFFVTSAGIKGAEALDVLEMSAKASAVGLGDTATIADLVTSAMNAYGSDTLSAADATDTLTAAVREGKLEPDALAGAMGRVLPMASALGVEFHEVGAGMAAMSRTGTTAREAATQLRSILQGILSPAQGAAEGFAEVGLTAEGLQSQLRDEGLLATLQTLVGAFDGNAAATEAVFGNIRALTGVMDLMGSNAQATEQIFDELTDTVGATDDAFEVMSETAGFKMQQAWVDMQAALVQAGDVILPVVTGIVEAVGTLAQGFGSLPGPAQTAALGILGVVAAVGPLTRLGGGIVTTLGRMGVSFQDVGRASRIASAAVGGVGAALVAAGIIYSAYAQKKAEAAEKTNLLIDALRQEQEGVENATEDSLLKRMADSGDLAMLEAHGIAAGDAIAYIRGEMELWEVAMASGGGVTVLSVTTLNKWRDAMGEATTRVESHNRALAEQQDTLRLVHAASLEAMVALGLMTRAEADAAAVLAPLTAGIEALTGQAKGMTGAFLDAGRSIGSMMGEMEAQADIAAWEGLESSISGALDAIAGDFDRAADAAGRFNDAMSTQTDGAIEWDNLLDDLHESFDGLQEGFEGTDLSMTRYTEEGRAARDATKELLDQASDIPGSMLASGQSIDSATNFTLGHVDALREQLLAMGLNEDELNSLIDTYGLTPERIETVIEQSGAQAVQDKMGEVAEAMGEENVPRKITSEVEALVAQGKYDEAIGLLDAFKVKAENMPDAESEAKFDESEAMAVAEALFDFIESQPDGESTSTFDTANATGTAEGLFGLIESQPDGNSTANIDASDAYSDIAGVTSGLNGLDGKVATSTIRTVYETIGVRTGVFGTPRARGGIVQSGELTLTGEKGPELAIFPAGTEIVPADRTASLLAQAKSFTSAASLGFDGGSSTSNTFDQSRQAIVNVAGVEGAQLGRIVRDAVDDALWKAGAGG